MQTASVNSPQRIWNTAVYVRISEAEREKSESDSIANQKKYIQKFMGKDNALNLYEIYCDDGHSGGNFNRPAFKKLISDIEKKIIDCVIVKDLSRFGREHIKTNHYLEIYFPSNKVRFISLGENIDSYANPKRMESIDIPFTNLINDHYLTQVSISTKSSLQIKQKEGKFVGALAPYGYLKASYNKHKLIIDEEVKDVVCKIFNDYTKGSTLLEIAKSLNASNISSPGEYRAKKSGKAISSKWKSSTVRNILCQPIYTGDMVQGKTFAPNHKVKKRIPQPKEKWIIVKNTHEAIIFKGTYSKAQDILSRDIKPTRQKCEEIRPSILAGYIYCDDCGGKMIRNSAVCNGKRIYRFLCSTYKNKGSRFCSSHYVQEDKLIELLFEIISLYTKIAVDETFIERAKEMYRKNNLSSFFMVKLKKVEKELEEVKMIRQGLYKDYKLNMISSSEYTDMKTGFEIQYNDLLKLIASLSKSIELEKTKKLPINEAIEYLKEHGMFKELTRNMVIKLVDRIIIGDKNEIKIIFNFENIFKDYAKNIATLQKE